MEPEDLFALEYVLRLANRQASHEDERRFDESQADHDARQLTMDAALGRVSRLVARAKKGEA